MLFTSRRGKRRARCTARGNQYFQIQWDQMAIATSVSRPPPVPRGRRPQATTQSRTSWGFFTEKAVVLLCCPGESSFPISQQPLLPPFCGPSCCRGRAACLMPPVATIKDVQEENDDEKRQAYYAGGQGQNGGGRCVLAPDDSGGSGPSPESSLHFVHRMPCSHALFPRRRASQPGSPI